MYLKIIAVRKLRIVYIIVAINRFKSPTTNVTIKNIEKIKEATKIGFSKIRCNVIEKTIVARLFDTVSPNYISIFFFLI